MTIKKLSIIPILSVLSLFMAVNAYAVDVRISTGLSNTRVKANIEQSLSFILSEINLAHEQKRTPNYSMLNLPTDVETTISALWENSPFFCIDDQVIEKCLSLSNNRYQIRNIPLLLTSPNANATDAEDYQEAVATFDSRGNIISFNLTISNQLYMDVLKQGMDITDRRYRELILDWTEQFRTAYNEHNIEFLDAVFSDDALIISGKVMIRKTADGRFKKETKYSSKTKAEYLRDLKRIFNDDKRNLIHVTFDEIEVMRHPNPDHNKMYGVTLHQKYTSARYSDNGYVFLLWDFTDEEHPQIHVRVWQEESFEDMLMTFDFEDFNG